MTGVRGQVSVAFFNAEKSEGILRIGSTQPLQRFHRPHFAFPAIQLNEIVKTLRVIRLKEQAALQILSTLLNHS